MASRMGFCCQGCTVKALIVSVHSVRWFSFIFSPPIVRMATSIGRQTHVLEKKFNINTRLSLHVAAGNRISQKNTRGAGPTSPVENLFCAPRKLTL